MMRFSWLLTLFMMIALTGCAGITPRNQSVSFTTPTLPAAAVPAPVPSIKDAKSDSKKPSSASVGIDKSNQVNQENYQSVQNSLVGVTGKLAEIKADIGKALEVNSKITGLEGDIAALRAENLNIKTQMKAEITAEVRAQVQAEITGIKATFNNNSNLPFSFMAGLVLIVVTLGGGLIFVIYQNSKQGKALKALSESAPVILPIK